ncbi:crotonase/enoyl-CoA hydratase family protein [Psychromonas sp. 14N.309.X.WAT.B.A12]|uniref:crotonase/enoyl-CoA hydratase family protein n=1 Tax=Psychromonas sp. 14N.309.X.WAT.B.A12 TaxID=2998322 RepID=UPI0025AF391E|nr:crotonase/enoyl-CoA hydratase family protein [Psychromonas sp. 14N.309.X.WAT.B.A12]MDN2663545.1 crotonase/enoyl-CoA hydratase family protein [Psychromonas sp. 14N.309.X.WAT.B.A12]
MNNLARVTKLQSVTKKPSAEHQYSQLSVYYDAKYKAGWYYMHASPRPCFTAHLLEEINKYQNSVKSEMKASLQQKYNYLVLSSDIEGIFNLGGDLAVFQMLIQNKDKDSLLSYAIKCIDVLYNNIVHLESELTTIALVQGDALGGGFEAALSSNLLIAEEGVKMGLPEVLFNLFPGMGAYTLLSRKIGQVKAEEIILSGKLYSAEELFELGIVDILAKKGEGEMEVYRYINSADRKSNSYQAIRKVKDIYNPITYQELIEITKIWVDSALNINDKDLRMMDKLVMRQTANQA